MQAVLLLAGKNSRFMPLNTIAHKTMFPIYGKPIVEYLINDLKDVGINEIIIVGNQYLDIIKNHFGDGKKHNCTIKYTKQSSPTGQGDAILTAKEFITEDFIVPNPYHINQKEVFTKLIKTYYQSNSDGIIPGIEVTNIHNYGALKIEGKRITGIIEKPAKGTEPSNIRATSAYIFKNDFIDYLENEPADMYSYESAISKYAQDKNLETVILTNSNPPTLKYPWHLLDIRDLIANTQTGFIHPSAKVAKNAIIGPNVYIDEGARIFENACIKGNTYIGKGAIVGNNAVIRDTDLGKAAQVGVNSDIARSIIMKGVHSHGGGFIGDSIVGDDARIAAGFCTANNRSDKKQITCVIKNEPTPTGRTSLGMITGKNTKFAINSATMPGKLIGENSQVGTRTTVFENIPANSSLASRETQQLKTIQDD